jgi:hypothetical protein
MVRCCRSSSRSRLRNQSIEVPGRGPLKAGKQTEDARLPTSHAVGSAKIARPGEGLAIARILAFTSCCVPPSRAAVIQYGPSTFLRNCERWRGHALCGAQVPDVDRIVACLRRILRNSADGAARFLNKATTHLGVVRIATTGKGVTIEAGVTIGTMVRSVTTETTGRGAMTMTTNSRLWGEDALPHQSAFRRDRWNHPALLDSLATSSC